MDIYEFSLTRGVRIYILWCKQINIFQNDYCSSSFSSWWISIFSKLNHSKKPLDMSWAKTKEISLEARRFKKYQSFLSFSAHNYETYFSNGHELFDALKDQSWVAWWRQWYLWFQHYLRTWHICYFTHVQQN